MRGDAIAPRTWLLLTIAGWAVLAWLLALSGMGGRIAPLPDDAQPEQALPSLPAPAPERLGPLQQYAQIGSRPLFASDRQPHPFVLEGQGNEQASKAFDYVLTSVLMTPNVRLAILQSPGEGGPASAVRVKLGESVDPSPAWRLVGLEPRQAVFEGPEGQRTLALRVFDGQGGQPPSQLNAAATAGRTAPPQPANLLLRAPGTAGASQARGAAPSAQADAAADAVADAEQAGASPPPLTTEQQMQAIRERIQARRQQMREQHNSGAPGTNK